MAKKKKKHATPKKPRVKKCVKIETEHIADDEIFHAIIREFEAYGACKDMFFQRFCGVYGFEKILDWKTARDIIRKEQKELNSKTHEARSGNKTIEEMFGVPVRIWTMALADVSQILCSMWSNLGNRCKAAIRDNHQCLTKEQRKYCNYVFSASKIWAAILEEKEPAWSKSGKLLADALSKEEQSRMNSLIRRLTRKYKPYPRVKIARCMLFDESMYDIRSEEDGDYLCFMSMTRGKRFRLKLKGKFCYHRRGNIQLVLDMDKKVVSIHKCIEVKERNLKKSGARGVDKGYATLLSCDSGNEYGKGFGEMVSNESERINSRNTNRNYFIQKKKQLKEDIKNLETANTKDGKAKAGRLKKELELLEKNHIGNKRYDKEHHKAKEHMTSCINHSIYEFVKTEKPKEAVVEDLTFTRTGKGKGKRFNRHMASWQKGVLEERISYICSMYGIKEQKVNPAYTSQYCSQCGRKLTGRKGKHNEITTCPCCGDMDANINAAINIRNRKDDKIITIYTPYLQVKKILDDRAPAA